MMKLSDENALTCLDFSRGRWTSSFSLALDFVIVVVFLILFFNINKIYLFSKNLWQPHGSCGFGIVSLSSPLMNPVGFEYYL